MNVSILPRRVAVVGVTGSGKTTMAQALSSLLGVPHVEMDALNWQQDWQPIERSEFRRRVDAATSTPAWVIDGNYREVRDLVWRRAEMLVWLDYSLALIYWRLLRRSLRRIVTREELWNGNRESMRGLFFSRDSLFVYAFHSRPELRRNISLGAQKDYPHLELVHLTSPGKARRWLKDLATKEGKHESRPSLAARDHSR